MLLLFLLSLNSLLHFCSAQQGPFKLITSRAVHGNNQNTLTLTCRDDNHIDYPNLFYWINSTQRELREILGDEYSLSSQGFNFEITRELEGFYFCGSDVNNTSGILMRPLIGKYEYSWYKCDRNINVCVYTCMH